MPPPIPQSLNITSKECSWGRFSMTILGREVKGLRGFSFKKTVEKEELMAAGDEAIDITTGAKKNSGSIKCLGFEVDLMNATARLAGYEDITEVPHEEIVISVAFKRRRTDPISAYIAVGVAFTEVGVDMEQNAKHREVTLPYICMKITQP